MSGLQVVGLVVIVFLAPAATAEPLPKSLPGDVTWVESGGYWEKGEQRGVYRVVVRKRCSPEHCYDIAQLEWMEDGSPSAKVVKTVRITEVGGLTVVAGLRFVFSKPTHLEIRQEATIGEDKSTHCLTLGLPGKYVAKSGACSGAG